MTHEPLSYCVGRCGCLIVCMSIAGNNEVNLIEYYLSNLDDMEKI